MQSTLFEDNFIIIFFWGGEGAEQSEKSGFWGKNILLGCEFFRNLFLYLYDRRACENTKFLITL